MENKRNLKLKRLRTKLENTKSKNERGSTNQVSSSIFKGNLFYCDVDQMSPNDGLFNLITIHGGKNVSYIIFRNGNDRTLKFAFDNNILCLNPIWVIDSISAGAKKTTEGYTITTSNSSQNTELVPKEESYNLRRGQKFKKKTNNKVKEVNELDIKSPPESSSSLPCSKEEEQPKNEISTAVKPHHPLNINSTIPIQCKLPKESILFQGKEIKKLIVSRLEIPQNLQTVYNLMIKHKEFHMSSEDNFLTVIANVKIGEKENEMK